MDQLRAEATARFTGQGGVVGVGVSQANRLTILMSEANLRQEQAIRLWARDHSVAVELVVTGILRAAASA
jgi:hypothetical protein